MTERKLRGGYYTSPTVAKFIIDWAIDNKNDTVLEPSCGDGAFVKLISDKYVNQFGSSSEEIKNNVIGVELLEEEARKAEKNSKATIINSDFFTYYKEKLLEKKFNVIVGNPPFIRYQNFPEEHREIAFKYMKELGLSPNRMTNIWVPFLVLCTELLEYNGKLGMVIPAELFQVDYAAQTRKFLSDRFSKLTIITFKKLLWKDAQQEVVLILGEKDSRDKGIKVLELNDEQCLIDLDLNRFDIEEKTLDVDSEKWIKYYLTNSEIELMRRIRTHEYVNLTTDYFQVNVGVVSGNNDFFVINQETVDKNYLSLNSLTRIIGRAEHVKGIVFTDNNYDTLREQGKPVFLFKPGEVLNCEDRLYIENGERSEVNKGYKCKIRKPWFQVPTSWIPQGFMLRQVHEYPKLILNNTDVLTTDTLHKIRFVEGVNPMNVCICFLNSFTFALSEITGRSYGGGVLTFEPGEVRRLLMPYTDEELDFTKINELILNGEIEKVLDYTDKILLIDRLGLSREEVQMLRNIWHKLKNRRINRKK